MFVVPLVSRFTKVTQNLQNRVIYTRYHAELMNRSYGGWLGDIIRAVMRQSVIEIVSFNTPHATSYELSIVTITFVNFAVSGLTSIRQLPLPLSFTQNLITVSSPSDPELSCSYCR